MRLGCFIEKCHFAFFPICRMAVVASYSLASFLYGRIFDNKSENLLKCFLEIGVNGKNKGHVVIELREDVAPRIVTNFLSLCTGVHCAGEEGKHKSRYYVMNHFAMYQMRFKHYT